MKELVEYILQFGNLNKQQIDLINVFYDVKAAVYQSSKSALNMYAVNLAYELKDTAFKVNAIDPGYTKTDFNYNQCISR